MRIAGILLQLFTAGCLCVGHPASAEMDLPPSVSTPADTNRTDVVSHWSDRIAFEDKSFSEADVGERFSRELARSGWRVVYDRYGPVSSFNWIQVRDQLGFGMHSYVGRHGRKTFYRTVMSAARETGATLIPIEDYTDRWRIWGGRLWSTVWSGTIGNVDEEETEVVSATPSYSTLKYISDFEWEDPESAWGGNYGLRPWRDNPYAYLETYFGQHEGRPLVRMQARCYGYLRPNDFGLVKVEGLAVIATSKRTQAVVGGAYYPFEDEPEHAPRVAVRWEACHRGHLFSAGVSTAEGLKPFWSVTYNFQF